MKNEQIKALIKEAIEEERKNRYKIYLRTFLVALVAVLVADDYELPEVFYAVVEGFCNLVLCWSNYRS